MNDMVPFMADTNYFRTTCTLQLQTSSLITGMIYRFKRRLIQVAYYLVYMEEQVHFCKPFAFFEFIQRNGYDLEAISKRSSQPLFIFCPQILFSVLRSVISLCCTVCCAEVTSTKPTSSSQMTTIQNEAWVFSIAEGFTTINATHIQLIPSSEQKADTLLKLPCCVCGK